MISSVSDNTNRFMLMDSSSYEIVFSLNKDLKEMIMILYINLIYIRRLKQRIVNQIILMYL